MVTLVSLVLIAASPVNDAEFAGRVVSLRGDPTIQHGTLAPVAMLRGDIVRGGDRIKTTRDASLRILLQDDSVLDVAPSSSLRLDAFSFKAKEKSRLAKITMFIGSLWARVSPNVSDGENFFISTPNAVAGVRGTSLLVDVKEGGQTQVTVVSGTVQVRDSYGRANLLQTLQQSNISKKSHTVNRSVNPQTVASFKSALTIRSTLNKTGSENRLQTVDKAIVDKAPPQPATPPVADNTAVNKAPPQRDQGVATVPILDIDPSRNISRLRINVRIKD